MEVIKKLIEKMSSEEKSKATIDKYVRDISRFIKYLDGRPLTKDIVIAYKNELHNNYKLASVNTMIASINYYLIFIDRQDCTVKQYRTQMESFREDENELTIEEYQRLLAAAKARNMRAYYIMQTICGTGIRISELQYITVESLKRHHAIVSSKNKTRKVIIPDALCKMLFDYSEQKNITSGSIFITRAGKPVDRSNIAHEMKSLCKDAKVDPRKVYPHNLRHLFAVMYYKNEKDISNLADLLGHSNINTTRIYTRISRQEQQKLIDRLSFWEEK